MSDALSGKTEVDSTVEDVVSAEIQMVLVATAVMPGTLLDFSAAVRPGMDTLKIPKFGAFTVASKSENTAVDAQLNAFSSDDLALDKHKVVQWLLEDIANLQAKVAVNQAYVNQAGKDLAAEMDLTIINALESGVSTSAPDHKVAYANSGSANTIGKADIVGARKLLSVQNVPLADRYLLVDPASEADILSIDAFVKANEIGSDEPVRNGEIGKLYGFTVLVSAQAETAKSLAYHKTAAAFARQMMPRYQTESALAHLGGRHSVDHLYGVKVLDAGKRLVLLGTA